MSEAILPSAITFAELQLSEAIQRALTDVGFRGVREEMVNLEDVRGDAKRDRRQIFVAIR